MTNKQMLVAQLRKEQEQNRILRIEIENLKDEIIYLERKIAIRDNALKDSDKAIEMLEGKQDTIVKQAQIDVLNKLKKCDVYGAVPLKYFDELIKEVEDDKKN